MDVMDTQVQTVEPRAPLLIPNLVSYALVPAVTVGIIVRVGCPRPHQG